MLNYSPASCVRQRNRLRSLQLTLFVIYHSVSFESYVVTIRWNHLDEMIPTNGHNIGFAKYWYEKFTIEQDIVSAALFKVLYVMQWADGGTCSIKSALFSASRVFYVEFETPVFSTRDTCCAKIGQKLDDDFVGVNHIFFHCHLC